jgi:hypothetical protein
VSFAVSGVADVERELRDTGDVGRQVLCGLAAAHDAGGRNLDAVSEHAEGDAALPTCGVVDAPQTSSVIRAI